MHSFLYNTMALSIHDDLNSFSDITMVVFSHLFCMKQWSVLSRTIFSFLCTNNGVVFDGYMNYGLCFFVK